MQDRPRLFLVDAFNLIFRAYHARQRTNAAPMRTSRGTSTEAVYIFHNMIRRLERQFTPNAIACAYESKGPTLREQEFPAYKANRSETPPELLEQFPIIERMLRAMRVAVVAQPGYEADDIIATLATRAAEAGYDVTIVSSDKDLLQLVGDNVCMLDPMKGDTFYDAAKVREFKGVAPAQIADLLALAGDSVDNIPGAPGIGDKGAVQLLEQFGTLETLLERAAEVQRKAYRESLQNNREIIELSKRLATVERNVPVDIALDALHTQAPDAEALGELYRELEFYSFLKDLEVKHAPAPEIPTREAYTVSNEAELADVLAKLDAHEPLAISFDAPSLDGLQTGSFAIAGPRFAATLAWDLLPAFRDAIKGRPIRVFDYKKSLTHDDLDEHDAEVDDILLKAFLVHAEPSACEFESLCARYLSDSHPANAAEAIETIAGRLEPALDDAQRALYAALDLPLAPVLARMERTGIRIDRDALASLAKSMQTSIDEHAAAIYKAAGHEFNINSPQQLGKVLFEELGLPAQGKTGKTKSYSTAADVLESLAEHHAIARSVLDFRQVTKLKSTYVDQLPQLADSAGRIHTTFNPAGAATGRLSSSDPNLQNIPVRTALGRDIRAAFVPEPGWVLLTADYSQIELRLLAHFSGDSVLLDAFRHNEDIHTRTASEVFGVPPLMVTGEMRRNAKAVNFGIVYGQTAFGLASQLGVPRDEAERYIRGYFERYAGVKRWIERTVAEVRERGYTLTLDGRRRTIPDIAAKNPNARNFAERTAVNTPLQGTAADLIKRAMIQVDADLRAERRKSRMLLQVHDELVLECPPEELAEVTKMVKFRMETVADLKVPLLVETGTGTNWRDAK